LSQADWALSASQPPISALYRRHQPLARRDTLSITAEPQPWLPPRLSQRDARRATSCSAPPAAHGGRQTLTVETEIETETPHDPRATRRKRGRRKKRRIGRHARRTPPGNPRRPPPKNGIEIEIGLRAEKGDLQARTRQKLPPTVARCPLFQRWSAARRWAVRESRAIHHSQRRIAKRPWEAKKTSSKPGYLHTRQTRQIWAVRRAERMRHLDMQVEVKQTVHQVHL
jgi:hypothetical protein